MTDAEGAETDKLMRGGQVPGHRGACGVEGCAHGILWHGRRGKRACEAKGCPCAGLVRIDLGLSGPVVRNPAEVVRESPGGSGGQPDNQATLW
jgi:hypothetical protein